jgi:hypothetical protein
LFVLFPLLLLFDSIALEFAFLFDDLFVVLLLAFGVGGGLFLSIGFVGGGGGGGVVELVGGFHLTI